MYLCADMDPGAARQHNPKDRPMRTNLMTTLTLALCSPAALAQGPYSVAVIDPLPGHSSVSTNAINNPGEAGGVSYGSPINNQTPYIFRPGQGGGVQPLPFPPGMAF